MSLTGHLSQTVTVVVRNTGAADDYGHPTVTYTDGATVAGLVQPMSADERSGNNDAQIGSHRAFLPSSVSVTGLDRLRVDGTTYEVVGPPMTHIIPNRGPHHIQAELRVVT